MGWRAIVISNPASLRIADDRLVIAQQEEVRLPLEDLAAVIIESPQVTCTATLLTRLAQHDILLLMCDEKHLPCGALLPTAGHSRLAKMQRMQLDTTQPFRKRCWQMIVRQKVANQAACLGYRGRAEAAAALQSLVPAVGSGDTTNVEAQAARRYFPALFRPDFLRSTPDPLNAALDYGYAILRGAVARALAAHGLLLAQGVQHHSELNPFNLADDFLEPYRPVVDLCAGALMADAETLTKEHRAQLVGLLGCDVAMDGQQHPVLHAAEITAASFVTACREKDPGALRLPTLVSLSPHRYG